VFLFHWKEESQHAILDELEWRREDMRLVGERARSRVDDLIKLVGDVDALVQVQAAADADYFLAAAGRKFSAAEQVAIADEMLKAYRWQYIVSGATHDRFGEVLASLVAPAQMERIGAALARSSTTSTPEHARRPRTPAGRGFRARRAPFRGRGIRPEWITSPVPRPARGQAIRLLLLGPPEAQTPGGSRLLPFERASQLAACLALKGTWTGRAEVAALLWPGQEGKLAYANLRKTLFRMQSGPFANFIEVQGGALRLDAATDVADFEAAMREGRVADALALHRGAFLAASTTTATNRGPRGCSSSASGAVQSGAMRRWRTSPPTSPRPMPSSSPRGCWTPTRSTRPRCVRTWNGWTATARPRLRARRTALHRKARGRPRARARCGARGAARLARHLTRPRDGSRGAGGG
jgi:hypothetical protein